MSDELELELADETLINRCLKGNILDPKRPEACKELADRCFTRQREMSEEERKQVHRKLITEAATDIHPDVSSPPVEVKGTDETFQTYSMEPSIFWRTGVYRNNMLQEGEVDEELMDDIINDKDGDCRAALLGSEEYFTNYMTKFRFQPDDHPEFHKYVERRTLFADEGGYGEDGEWYFQPDSNLWIYRCYINHNPKFVGDQLLCALAKEKSGGSEEGEGQEWWLYEALEEEETLATYKGNKPPDNTIMFNGKEYQKKASWSCIHNLIGLAWDEATARERLHDEIKEVAEQVKRGELSEEEQWEAIERLTNIDIALNTKYQEFDPSSDRVRFKQRLQYMPIRLRLFQTAQTLNNYVNDYLIQAPLLPEDSPLIHDKYFNQFFHRAANDLEEYQLENNVILSSGSMEYLFLKRPQLKDEKKFERFMQLYIPEKEEFRDWVDNAGWWDEYEDEILNAISNRFGHFRIKARAWKEEWDEWENFAEEFVPFIKHQAILGSSMMLQAPKNEIQIDSITIKKEEIYSVREYLDSIPLDALRDHYNYHNESWFNKELMHRVITRGYGKSNITATKKANVTLWIDIEDVERLVNGWLRDIQNEEIREDIKGSVISLAHAHDTYSIYLFPPDFWQTLEARAREGILREYYNWSPQLINTLQEFNPYLTYTDLSSKLKQLIKRDIKDLILFARRHEL
jgi:hypothetical protein